MANGAGGKPLGGIARAFAAMRGRLYQAPPVTIDGVNSQSWPSALQPVQPTGPKGSQPLSFSFWQGINQDITPRADSALTFADLRELASYPIARVCIENVKDVLLSMPWKIQLRRIAGEAIADWKGRQKQDKNIPILTEFFEYPDGETPWSDWGRPIIEDLLTIDAPSILVQRTLSGSVVKLRWTDGSQFLKLIDDQGNTPQGDNPAYTQLWEGIPRIFLTTSQLVYRPSNIVPRNSYASKLYGMSIVEQLATEIRIGQERLRFVLAFYTEGSVPGLVHVVPPGVTADKINDNMQWMNSELAGALAKRRQWRMVQGMNADRDDQIIQLKEPVLADAFDEVHIRKIAYGFGVSAQRLLKAMNRASADANQDASEKEGIMPRLKWLKGTMDLIIQRQMDFPQYEMVFDTNDELDAVKQATVDDLYVSKGQRTIDELRDERGLVPFGLPETSMPIIITATGVQPLEGSIDRTNQQLENDTAAANKPAPQPVAAPQKKTLKSASKAVPVISGSKLSPKNLKFQLDLEYRINRWFQETANRIGDVLEEKYGESGTVKLLKDDDDGLQTEVLLGGKKVPKLESDTIRAIALLAWKAVDWKQLVGELQPYIEAAVMEGVDIGTAQVAVESVARTAESAKEAAQKYASERSAELAGMRVNSDGELVSDPGAKWPLTDVMKRDLEMTVALAVEEGWTASQLAAVIEASYALSSERAAVVANTELTNAQSFGTYTVWKNSGVVTMARWVTSDLEREPDECDEYEAQGIVPLGHEFAPGIWFPRAHPNCRCNLEVVHLGDD